jgi:hypothetical protein
MAQNQFINITTSPTLAKVPDRSDHRGAVTLAAASSGDLTLSWDSTKFTTPTQLRGAIDQALKQVQAMGM